MSDEVTTPEPPSILRVVFAIALTPLAIVRGYAHQGAWKGFGLIALGLGLDFLAQPPAPFAPAILVADAPFLWLLWMDGGARWKRWVFLYAVCHFGFGVRWLAEIHLAQIFGAAIGLSPLYLFLGWFLRRAAAARLPYVLCVGAGVVLVEIFQTIWFGGMPWPARSLSFAPESVPGEAFFLGFGFVPAAAYLGAYAFSFLAGTTSAVVSGLPALFRAPSGQGPAMARRVALSALLPLAFLGVLVGLSALREAEYAERVDLNRAFTTSEAIVVVQANVPMKDKHYGDDYWETHIELARAGILQVGETDVCAVLLPETMLPWPILSPELAARYPDMWAKNVEILRGIRMQVPEGLAATWLVGAIYYFRRGDELHRRVYHYGKHDSLFQLEPRYAPKPGDPNPRVEIENPDWFPPWQRARHDKVDLVPGGEYTPAGEWLPFLRWFRNIVSIIPELDKGDVEQPPMTIWEGHRYNPLLQRHRTLQAEAGSAICFELAFPRRCRQIRSQGANVLLNPSNYAWFGETDFRSQIRSVGRLRAAELGVSLVMAGNTGPTMCYDPVGVPYGVFHPVAPEGGVGPAEPAGGDETTHREGFMTARLAVDPEPTLYTAMGDVPWWVLGLLLVGGALLRGRTTRRVPAEAAERPDSGAATHSEGIG